MVCSEATVSKAGLVCAALLSLIFVHVPVSAMAGAMSVSTSPPLWTSERPETIFDLHPSMGRAGAEGPSPEALPFLLAASSTESSRSAGTLSPAKTGRGQPPTAAPSAKPAKKLKKNKRHVPAHAHGKRTATARRNLLPPSPPLTPIGPPGTCFSVLVVGDSLAVGVGMTLDAALLGHGNVVVRKMGKISSGLDSPGFYDWNGALSDALNRERFDLVVILMGANDAHNAPGTADWGGFYESRFSEFLRIVAVKRVRALVVGLPPMKAEDFCRRVLVANHAIRNASQLFPETCVYVDSFSRFSDGRGNFVERIDVDGELKKVRAGDGVHFTGTGYLEFSRMLVNEAFRTRPGIP